MACTIPVFRPPCSALCDEFATVEVLDRKGQKRGSYCDRHGEAALKKLHAEELAASPPRVASTRMVGAQRVAP